MGISAARQKTHVGDWLGKFVNFKKSWPRHLFHHANVETAISILKTGALYSREDALAHGVLQNDIAPEEIVQNQDAAHPYVRLYFRPRTPTQHCIEGIRKPVDYFMGRHGGFLVMLAFRSEDVLTMESTKFSTGNMQSPYSRILDGDAGFDELDFAGIYHDKPYPSDDEKRKRCAEVLSQSPLDIATTLAAIIVRTDADAATMRFLLTCEGLGHMLPLVKKSQGTGIFFNEYTALEFVDTAPGRISFKLKGTKSTGDIQTVLTVFDAANTPDNLVTQELRPNHPYYTEHNLPAGSYRLLIKLEGCYAHESLAHLVPK